MKKLSILEDLIPLLPTSPFQVRLDNKNMEKNIVVLSENLGFSYSDELINGEQEKTFSSEIAAYVSSDEKNANFDSIYAFLEGFFENIRAKDGQVLGNKKIVNVGFVSPFGYLGRDKNGDFTFILNLQIDFEIIE